MPAPPVAAETLPAPVVAGGVAPAPPDRCAACAEALTGPYCASCGERRLRPEDESLWRFLREQAHEVTSADGKLWRTFKALFVPGQLTADYLAGRRGLYPRPVRVFLVLNVVLFFYFSGNSGTMVKGPLGAHLGAPLYGDAARTTVESRLERTGVSAEQFEVAFDAKAETLAPSLIGTMVPAFAVLFALVMWRKRASGVRHLVLATHTVTAIMATMLVLMTVISVAFAAAKGVGWQPTNDSIDPVLVPSFLTLFSAYLAVSFRRVYQTAWPWSVVAGVLVGTVGLFAALVVYQAVLFVVTLQTLDLPA